MKRILSLSSLPTLIAICITALYSLAAVLVSVNRFKQYEVFYYDFGIYDQAIWKVSRFQAPIIEHLVIGGKWNLADHFTPSMYLLSPLYWLSDKQEIVLAAQAIAVGLSGFFIWSVAAHILKNKWYALPVMMLYLLFVGLQNAIISDLHEVTVMVLPLSVAIWAIVKGRVKTMYLAFVIALGFKESNFLLGLGLGAFLFLVRPSWWKHVAIMGAASLLWGYLTINIFIPYFAGTPYQYMSDFPKNPVRFMQSFVNSDQKRETLLITFGSFAFLPLLAPITWPLIFQDFVPRFIPEVSGRATLGLHYSAMIAPIMGLGVAYGLALLFTYVIKHVKVQWAVSLALMILALYLHQFVYHGPLGLAYNRDFYRHSSEFGFLNKLIELVPKDATVMTQNNLASHFTHQTVWLFRPNYDYYNPEYMVFDLRDGQNINDFFGGGDVPSIYRAVKEDVKYELIYSTKEQFVFKRKS